MAAQPASHQRHTDADVIVDLEQEIGSFLERPGDCV
jgi:hypothetical protein